MWIYTSDAFLSIVAHRTADKERLVAALVKAIEDLERGPRDVLAGYAVLLPGNDLQAGLCL